MQRMSSSVIDVGSKFHLGALRSWTFDCAKEFGNGGDAVGPCDLRKLLPISGGKDEFYGQQSSSLYTPTICRFALSLEAKAGMVYIVSACTLEVFYSVRAD